MAWRNVKLKRLSIGAIFFCFFIALYIGSSSLPISSNKEKSDAFNKGNLVSANEDELEEPVPSKFQEDNHKAQFPSGHHLGVIVPYRDRFEELLIYAPYIHRFLKNKKISHDIIVVNQCDSYRFNRAALINVGFTYATSHQAPRACDYIAMHDVDLLPLNHDLPYDYPPEGSVMHVAAPGLHPKYNYKTFIGGILLVSVADYKKVDGMSNIYWGWGMEDDEFYVRLKQANIPVNRPEGLSTGRANTFRHVHSQTERPRDRVKCFDQFNKTKRRDRLTGLSNVNYTFVSISHLTIDEAPLVVLNVKFQCNTQISPWCDCSQNNSSSTSNSTSSTSSPILNKSNNMQVNNNRSKNKGKLLANKKKSVESNVKNMKKKK